MAGPVLIAWLAAGAWACEDVAQQLGWAEEGLLEADATEARAALDLAEEGLGCGPAVPAATLARFFLLDGAIGSLEGDAGATAEAFAAARRIDAGVWIDALGARLREQHEAATSGAAGGRLEVEAPGWEVRLDGVVLDAPREVPAGWHVVQVVGDGQVRFGRVVRVEPGEALVVSSGLEARQAAPAPVAEVAVPRDEGGSSVALSLGVGLQGAFGEALTGAAGDGSALSEPGTKLTVPVDVGVAVAAGPVALRPALGIAPLLGGKFLYATDDGAGAAAFAWLAELAVGARPSDAIEVGGLAGVAWPGRIVARGFLGLPDLAGPLGAELRAGVNLGTAGRVEPAASLGLRARLP